MSVASYLLNEVSAHNQILRGKVLIVLNIEQAAERYVSGPYESAGANRYVECDMNRLPATVMTNALFSSYDYIRARDLLPVWSEFDIALDVHSTRKPKHVDQSI